MVCSRIDWHSPCADVESRLTFTNDIVYQVRYAAQAIPPAKSARARGSYLRVSFKNTRETAQAINGWKLQRAVKYLENVSEQKEAVPMRRYAGGTGRSAQGKHLKPRQRKGITRRSKQKTIECLYFPSGALISSLGGCSIYVKSHSNPMGKKSPCNQQLTILARQVNNSVSLEPVIQSNPPNSFSVSLRMQRPTPMSRALTLET
jgi:Ribosomal protein L22p/L17e